MKVTCKMFRCTTIRTAELMAAAGFDGDEQIAIDLLMKAVREKFRPFSPRFKIFFPSDVATTKTVVGIEAMVFDIPEANVPMAGLVMMEPGSPEDTARADGALESELNRMGIGTDLDDREWRMSYELKGN